MTNRETDSDEQAQVEWRWLDHRGRGRAHLFVKGAGTGDAALCGALAGPGHYASTHPDNPCCSHCAAYSRQFQPGAPQAMSKDAT